MSDNFNNRDYGDYFKALEKEISGEKKKRPTFAEKPKCKKKRNPLYRVIRIRPTVIICALVLTALIISIAVGSAVKSNGSPSTTDSTASENAEVVKPEKQQLTVYTETADTLPFPDSNDCVGGIVINKKTHEIIAQRNPHERLYPASTTKIMTVLVAAEEITDYTDTFTMSLDITDPLYIAEASVAGFAKDEVIVMTDLFYGTILPSGADAAMALAIKVAGSETEFAKLMNKKVAELGLKNTHFTNVTGLFDEDQYTSAYDLAIILEEALKYPLCKKVLSTYQYTTQKTEQHPGGIPLSSTLFNYMYGTEPETATILGGKTGFVNESGYCIATYGENNSNENEYITVTLKNSSRKEAFSGQIELYKQFAK